MVGESIRASRIYITSRRLTRFCSPLNTSGSPSSLRFRLAFLCRNWWLLCDFRRVIFPVPVTLNRLTAVLFVFSLTFFAIFLLQSRLWRKHHDHQAPIQCRSSFHGRHIDTFLGKHVEFFASQFGVRDFSRFKHTGDFHLMSFFQKSLALLNLEREVVLSDSRTDLYTLYFRLFALFILALLAFQILVLAVIDDSGNGWNGGSGDEDEVEPFIFRDLQRLSALHDSQLFAFGADHSDVAELQDPLVNIGARFRARRAPKSCYVQSPRMSSMFCSTLKYSLHLETRQGIRRNRGFLGGAIRAGQPIIDHP